jgi:hypothetical protein
VVLAHFGAFRRNSRIWRIWRNSRIWRKGAHLAQFAHLAQSAQGGAFRRKEAHFNAKGRISGHIRQFIMRTKRTQGLQRKTLNEKVSNILFFSIALVRSICRD